MAGKQEKKKAGAQASSPSHKRKIGETFGRLPEKKLRNILRCNGVNAAKIYAEHFGLEGILKKLLPTITDGHLVAEKRWLGGVQRCSRYYWPPGRGGAEGGGGGEGGGVGRAGGGEEEGGGRRGRRKKAKGEPTPRGKRGCARPR